MLSPIIRVVLRYGVPAFALWIGLPSEMVDELVSDPEFLSTIGAIAGGSALLIEGWYVWAKTRGGAT